MYPVRFSAWPFTRPQGQPKPKEGPEGPPPPPPGQPYDNPPGNAGNAGNVERPPLKPGRSRPEPGFNR